MFYLDYRMTLFPLLMGDQLTFEQKKVTLTKFKMVSLPTMGSSQHSVGLTPLPYNYSV